MGWDFILSISSLIVCTALGIRLAFYNHKMRAETHDLRMAIYRQRKKLKNERLRIQLEAVRRQRDARLEADGRSQEREPWSPSP
jgi:cell division protein FtsL